MMRGGREGTARTFTGRDLACQCAGAAGSVLSCAGMILSLAAGLLGAAGGAAAPTGMAGMESMSGSAQAHVQAGASLLLAVLTFLNRIAVPLLLASILLMLLGVARAGWRALGLVTLGSALLLDSMVPASFPVLALLLGGGFALIIAGYVVTWRTAKRRQQAPA